MNRISARQGKYRRSREGHGVPRRRGRVPGLYRGGGKSATVSRQMRFTFPERTGEECRQNGRRAESAIPPLGESATVSRQIDSLSRKGLARNAGRMAVEPRARFLPWEKVLRFHGKSIHISPPKKTNVRLSDQYDRGHSLVFYVARAGAIYENCWSSRKLSVLRKRL